MLLALVALWHGANAGQLATKALLAQLLLERAFARTLAGDGAVRPWPWADTWPLARLAMGDERLIVLAGASGRNLAFGPAHVDATPLPGAAGTSVIAGHRDTHFAVLRRLLPGDSVRIESALGTLEYRVTATAVIHESDTAILHQHDGPARLALVTCYPFDALEPGTPWRYLVLAESERDSATAPAMPP